MFGTAVKSAIEAFSLLAKRAFSDLFGQGQSSLIINFEHFYHVSYAFQNKSTPVVLALFARNKRNICGLTEQ